MRNRPDLNGDQHGVAQPAPDPPGRGIDARQRYEGEPHQRYGQMTSPCRRGPHYDQPLRPITGKAPNDEGETGEGYQRIDALEWPRAEPFNQARPRLTKGRETMYAEQDDDPQHENKHASLPRHYSTGLRIARDPIVDLYLRN